MPVPGMPYVVRVPRGPNVFVKPRGPSERLGPERDRFTRTPGAMRIRRKRRQPMSATVCAARPLRRGPPYLVAVAARDSGLDRDGFAKCDQPATLPVAALGPRAGRLAPEVIDRLDAALRFVLDL